MPILRQVDEDGLTSDWNITPFVVDKENVEKCLAFLNAMELLFNVDDNFKFTFYQYEFKNGDNEFKIRGVGRDIRVDEEEKKKAFKEWSEKYKLNNNDEDESADENEINFDKDEEADIIYHYLFEEYEISDVLVNYNVRKIIRDIVENDEWACMDEILNIKSLYINIEKTKTETRRIPLFLYHHPKYGNDAIELH